MTSNILFPKVGLKFLRSGTVLGEGGFSTVFVARPAGAAGKERFAIKQMLIQSAEDEKLAQNEIRCLTEFAHPHIIKLLDTATGEIRGIKAIFLLFPLCPHGTLRQKLDRVLKNESERLPLKVVLTDFLSILCAVQIMHDHQPDSFVHRDIKPDNVFFCDNFVPVLADFGSARPATISVQTRLDALNVIEEAGRNVTVPYRSPELFDPKTGTVLDCRTDIWALGCLLYAWWFGYSPFESEFRNGVITVVETSHLRVLGDISRPPTPSDEDALILDLVQWVCAKEIGQRPFVDEVILRVTRVRSNIGSRVKRSPDSTEFHDGIESVDL